MLSLCSFVNSRTGLKNGKTKKFQIHRSLLCQLRPMLPRCKHYDVRLPNVWWSVSCFSKRCVSVKIKTLVKKGFDVTPSLKVQEDSFLLDVDQCLDDVEFIQLGEESRQISDNIAGYLSHKTRDVFASCCGNSRQLPYGGLGQCEAAIPHLVLWQQPS